MFCTKCGIELREGGRFCSQCGRATGVGTATGGGPLELTLDKRNKKIAGVCAGFARYMDVDVTLVRVIWLAVALMTGVGFIAYLVAWLLMPGDRGLDPGLSQRPEADAGQGQRQPDHDRYRGPGNQIVES